ncbi:MAG TPA: sigma factor-like helix-turn-helix DNA-binding protein [Nocardioidaceae bacterium]|nr:sigma factor-like helix-turn-helix DNA-binding protein [Nocardioidaceae bacterium]
MTGTDLSRPAARGWTAKDGEFADFMAARQAALLRTAYLLTGDPVEARELATSTLGKLNLAWAGVRSGEGADVFLRRVMFRAHTSPWRRLGSSRRTAQHQTGGSDLWRAVGALPARQRALVVLCHYEGLVESEAAEVLGISLKRATSLLAQARESLGVPAAA